MATTGPTMGTATAGNSRLQLWLWASLALLRGRNTDLNSRVNRSRWRKPRQGRIPPPDQPAEEPGSRPPRVAGFLLCLQSPSSEPTNLMGYAGLMSASDAVDGSSTGT